MTANNSEYGEEVQINKSYEHLTPKQQGVVDAIVDNRGRRRSDNVIAERAGCVPSYVPYVEEHFPHIIDERLATMRVATDGGEERYELSLSADFVFRAIKHLPPEMGQTMFDQVRRQDVATDGYGEGGFGVGGGE